MTDKNAYKKIGKQEFINGHTLSCHERQKRLGTTFGKDSEQCACNYFMDYLEKKQQAREEKRR